MAKILVVDDAKFMRKTLGELLREGGFEIAGEAENGREAIDLYQETQPDLVIMDITMPEMDGITALEQIITADPDAKIVMCSAMGQQKLVVKAIEMGAKDFITKPFDDARVLDAVNRILN